MNELESLNKIPKEHYTEHHGKAILIRDLIKVLEEEAEEILKRKKKIYEEDSSDGFARRGEDDLR
jgi:23S rRNA maturation mini-RNase III